MIVPHVTFGVNCMGNVQALLLCLSSVLQGRDKPWYINVRMEGEFPVFGNFYLEQLAALAAYHKVEFCITYAQSEGVRKARDWQIQRCTTDLLWMGDDDCIYQHQCLAELMAAEYHLHTKHDIRNNRKIGYINGSKPDVNNRRGYGNFSTNPYHTSQLVDGASMNQFWEGPPTVGRTNTMDTGNVLLFVKNLRDNNIWFNKFGKSYNSGGEDTLMGLHCNNEGLLGWFAPLAQAIHLEKPGHSPFGEFNARGEMLRRACEQLGIPMEHLEKEFMCFVHAKGSP